MYLQLSRLSGPITVVFAGPEACDDMLCYRLSDEGSELLRQWHADYRTNQHLSGIFADWLEDHREEVLAGATGAPDPAVQLDHLIVFLRQKFRNERPAPLASL